jgi:hypothetical protein
LHASIVIRVASIPFRLAASVCTFVASIAAGDEYVVWDHPFEVFGSAAVGGGSGSLGAVYVGAVCECSVWKGAIWECAVWEHAVWECVFVLVGAGGEGPG